MVVCKTCKESVVEGEFCRQAELGGGFVGKWVDPTRRGAPDRVLVMPFGVYFVELKRPKGKAKVHQENYHKLIRKAGGEVYLVDSVEAVHSFYRMIAP